MDVQRHVQDKEPRNQGQTEKKERGKNVMVICRCLKDEVNGRGEGFSQWRQVAGTQVLHLPVPGCIILSTVPPILPSVPTTEPCCEHEVGFGLLVG